MHSDLLDVMVSGYLSYDLCGMEIAHTWVSPEALVCNQECYDCYVNGFGLLCCEAVVPGHQFTRPYGPELRCWNVLHYNCTGLFVLPFLQIVRLLYWILFDLLGKKAKG